MNNDNTFDVQDNLNNMTENKENDVEQTVNGSTSSNETDTRISELEIRNDVLTRQLADSMNALKHAEQKSSLARYDGMVDIAKILISFFDDLSRALESISDKNSPILNGLRIILDKLENDMKNKGIIKIDAEGMEFDPNQMNVIAVEGSGDVVKKVEMTGWKMKVSEDDYRIIRVAQVVIG